jgi:type IV pilus assembly protein PilQ
MLCCVALVFLFSSGVFAAEGADPLLDMPVLAGLTVHQVGDGLVSVEISGTSLPRPELRRERPNELEFFFYNVSLPSGRWEKDYHLPLVRRIAIDQEARGLVMRVETEDALILKNLRGTPPANKLVLELSLKNRASSGVAPVAPPQQAYSSLDPLGNRTPVTLELQGADLRDVFRMLAKTMNMNVILDPSTPDTPVTLSLKHVPLRDAFSYLMRMYDIRYAVMGQTLLIGRDTDLARTLGKEVTRSYRVAYGDPAAVAAMLKELVRVERVTVDERLRELYVTASPTKLFEVERILQKVDHPGKQVMIQARIVETKNDNSDSLEAVIAGVYKHWHFAYGAGGATLGYIDTNLWQEYDPDKDEEGIIPIPDGIDVDNITTNTMRMLDAGLNSLVKADKGEVLARPSVITVAGEKASIKLTTQTKYISGKDEAGNPTYGDVEAGPTLEFLPTIGRENMINLEIKVSTGSVTFKQSGSALFPEKSSREVDTRIRVRNGEPFVIGGLFSHNKSENETKFPILGDLPLLGEIFRWRTKSDTVTEVAIIVVPYVLDIPEGPVENEMVLKNELVMQGY